MKRNLSRRDFLKFAGMGLGAIALRPINLGSVYTPKPMPQFPNSEMLGRFLAQRGSRIAQVTIPPQASAARTLYDDKLVEWGREVVGNVVGLTNQRFIA
jgi:hypothetical protein